MYKFILEIYLLAFYIFFHFCIDSNNFSCLFIFSLIAEINNCILLLFTYVIISLLSLFI